MSVISKKIQSAVLKAIGASAAVVLSAQLAQAGTFSVSTNSGVKGQFPNAQFANAMGCTGDNISPQVSWKNAPKGTQSFVVTMYDPDAPTGSGWWHWVVANIPADVRELPAGAGSAAGVLPAGVVSFKNDGGQAGYGGICPPAGQTHRYVMTVHALKVKALPLPTDATPALVGFMTYANRIAKASTTLRGAQK